MKFSEWAYVRPDYAEVKTRLRDTKRRLENTSSLQDLRNVWLSTKKEIEYLEYQEEIIYIRHLCGIDYEKSLKEVALQNREDPEIYALRDECNRIVRNSGYRSELEKEFGKQIFQDTMFELSGMSSDSLKLQSGELQLKLQYRKVMANPIRDEEELFRIFHKMIETRCELADSCGLKNYAEYGYRLRERKDYGSKELETFRSQIQKSITPVCAEFRSRGFELHYPPAAVHGTKELISAIRDMFTDLSYESGKYIEEMIRRELYDVEERANKRNITFTCCMLPYEKVPFIIGNFSGGGMETGYIVHEFGHGFAFYTAARKQPLYELHRSTSSVNEIHSKTMEHFMYPYLNLFVGEHRQEYIRNHLMHQMENLAYRCAIDEFEHGMYEKPIQSRKQLCELWAAVSEKYMPWKEINKEEIEQGRYWPHQTHIVEHPFYYIEYNIAQISTYEFYNRMKRNQKQAWADYVKLCSAGGSKSYLELLEEADLANPFKEGNVSRICLPVIEELTK